MSLRGRTRRAAWAAASASTRSIATRAASWSIAARSSTRPDDGRDETKATLKIASQQTVQAGDFYTQLPPDGDIHYVKTVSEGPSVSIHLLANDTGCVVRHKYDPDAGAVIAFRSRYSNVRCSS